MTLLNYVVTKLQSGFIEFINMVTLANRDYPYHDYESIEDGSEPVIYQVGKNNMLGNNDQHKFFISKSTLIYSDVACTIRFNNTENIAIAILANTWYEFMSNISSVYVSAIASGGTIYMYFEGVLPQETRNPE